MSTWVAFQHPDGHIVYTDDVAVVQLYAAEHKFIAVANTRNACGKVVADILKERRRSRRMVRIVTAEPLATNKSSRPSLSKSSQSAPNPV